MTFWIQSGNPRTIRIVDEYDESISDALQTVFPFWTEEALMVWNRVHIPLNYQSIVSFIVADALAMVNSMMIMDSGQGRVDWPSSDFAATWDMSWSSNHLQIKADWKSVVGFTEPLLASRATIEMSKDSFISEWKQLFGVALRALTEAGYQDTQLSDLAMLKTTYEAIRESGILYRSS